MDHWSDGEAQTRSQSNATISDTAMPASGVSEMDLVPPGLIPEPGSQHSNLHLGSGLIPEPVSQHSNIHRGSVLIPESVSQHQNLHNSNGLIPEPVSNLHLGSGLIPQLISQHSDLHLGSGLIPEPVSQHSNVHFGSELFPHSLSRHSGFHLGSDVIPDPGEMSASGPGSPRRSSGHLPTLPTGSGLPQWSSGHILAPVAGSGFSSQSNVDLPPVGSHVQQVDGTGREGGDEIATEDKASDMERQSFSDVNSFSQTFRLAGNYHKCMKQIHDLIIREMLRKKLPRQLSWLGLNHI